MRSSYLLSSVTLVKFSVLGDRCVLRCLAIGITYAVLLSKLMCYYDVLISVTIIASAVIVLSL